MRTSTPTIAIVGLLFLTATFSGHAQRKVITGVTEGDFIGAIEDGQYNNNFFGLSFRIPNGWKTLTYAEMNAAKTVGVDGMKSNDAKADGALDKAVKAETVVVAISRKPLGAVENSVLAVGVAKQPSAAITPKMVAEASRSILLANPKNKSIGETRLETIGGKQFATFVVDLDLYGNVIRLRYYVTIVRGYSLTFNMSNSDPELDECLKSVKFSS